MTQMEKVYGGALYDLAREESLDEPIFGQLKEVISLFDETPDYWQFLSTLSISKAERCQALDEALGKAVHPYLLSFMKILCENGTIGQLKGCAQAYREKYNTDHNIVEVRAVTAIPMADALREKLLFKLQTVLGKTVELTCRVDPACMGGVRLELPERQLDGTVQHRLNSLSQNLKVLAI